MPARAGTTSSRRLARLALLPPAAFVVHQLRYLLAYGSAAARELAGQGHSYLNSVVPWLVMLIALAAGGFLYALGRALSGRRSVHGAPSALSRRASFSVLWIACAAALVAIYCSQETLEGLFATGHPSGLVGIFGNGGWWAIPAALVIGLLLALVFRGAAWVLDAVARRRDRTVTWPTVPVAAAAVPDVCLALRAPLAGGWSRRGPPR